MKPNVWIKAPCEAGACLEVQWTKACEQSSCVEVGVECDSTHCVEVGHNEDRWLVRDSKLGDDSPVLTFDRDEWEAFIRGVKEGKFDLP